GTIVVQRERLAGRSHTSDVSGEEFGDSATDRNSLDIGITKYRQLYTILLLPVRISRRGVYLSIFLLWVALFVAYFFISDDFTFHSLFLNPISLLLIGWISLSILIYLIFPRIDCLELMCDVDGLVDVLLDERVLFYGLFDYIQPIRFKKKLPLRYHQQIRAARMLGEIAHCDLYVIESLTTVAFSEISSDVSGAGTYPFRSKLFRACIETIYTLIDKKQKEQKRQPSVHTQIVLKKAKHHLLRTGLFKYVQFYAEYRKKNLHSEGSQRPSVYNNTHHSPMTPSPAQTMQSGTPPSFLPRRKKR
ncbi:MAG: hypothetical protein JW795_08615, partial [Chitinivibrionales bacterium]|nr:hypothetical protein [Chitinivibrionales bacterium]